jgi:spore coat polysaccharide biosynthesis protein SpsF
MNGILSMHDFFAFIQARSSSTRFPGKVLKSIPPESDKVIVSHIIERLIKIIPREKIVLLVPNNDSALIEYAQKLNVFFFEGSEDDVRDRFIQAAKKYQAEHVIRLTADNPFIDIEYIELLMEAFENPEIEIASFQGLPIGMGVEIFKMSSIEKTPSTGLEAKHKEHVSLHLKDSNEFKFEKFQTILTEEEKEICSKIRLTIDEELDYKVCCSVYEKLSPKKPFFGVKDIIKLYKSEPDLFKINQNVNQVSFTISPRSNRDKKIFILYAEPIQYGSGHYERCKSLSVTLESSGYEVTTNFKLPESKDYDLFIIDHRDMEIPEDIKHKTIILIDHFGQERYSYFPHDLLPHMFNEFEDVVRNSLFPIGIESYKTVKEKKQVLVYAGNLNFRSSFLLDHFAFRHFSDSNYEIIRIGGVPRKKANFGIKTLPKTNKREFLRLLAESEFFISYYGQSVMDASFLNKKILLYAISDYHEKLALHFSKNSEAVYVGNVMIKNMNMTASYQKFLRKVDLNLQNEGLGILKKAIKDLLEKN